MIGIEINGKIFKFKDEDALNDFLADNHELRDEDIKSACIINDNGTTAESRAEVDYKLYLQFKRTV